MAKNSIRDFSATAGSNTDIQSVNIDENCPASGINNAIRELMVDLKNVSTGAVNLETPAADSLTVAGDLTVDTNTLKVDSSNNRVGIGTTSSPATTLHISGNSNNTAALSDTVTDFALKFDSATTTNYFSNAICFGEGTNVNASIASFDGGSGGAQGLVFGTGASNTERLRLDHSGNLLLGTTTNLDTASRLNVKYSYTNSGAAWESNNTATHNAIVFKNPNGLVGTIQTSGSSTAYNTSSDHRLKQGVEDMTGAIDRVKSLAPKRFQFIADADTTVDGFLAHEAQTVVPEAVSGTHNEVDEDGNAVMQGIDQAKLVPLLTGALQEAIAKIETLETEMTALKARVTALEA